MKRMKHTTVSAEWYTTCSIPRWTRWRQTKLNYSRIHLNWNHIFSTISILIFSRWKRSSRNGLIYLYLPTSSMPTNTTTSTIWSLRSSTVLWSLRLPKIIAPKQQGRFLTNGKPISRNCWMVIRSGKFNNLHLLIHRRRAENGYLGELIIPCRVRQLLHLREEKNSEMTGSRPLGFVDVPCTIVDSRTWCEVDHYSSKYLFHQTHLHQSESPFPHRQS